MATPKLLSLSKLLRRRRPTLFISSSRPLCYVLSSNLSSPRCVSQPTPSTLHPFASANFFLDRSLFTRSSEHGRGLDPGGGESAAPLGQEEGLSGLGLVAGDGDDGSNGSEVAEALNSVGEAGAFEESLLPVNAVISFLDWYHDLTGFPWWVIIASSTFALRVTLLPVLILQLKKLREIAELFPKLPPPFPPPLSGKSYMDQLSLFHKERKAVGCPSYLWFISYVLVQVPCFLLWMTSIRRMSLNHHPGFECGGALWFQNLTEFPHGILGPLFPLIIGSLHFVNVKFSFQTSSVGKVPGLFGLLTKCYKFYLNLLTLPIILIGFYIPQGSLVYWVTNSSLTLIQQITLKNLNVREKLGLLDKGAPVTTANPKEIDIPRGTQQDQLRQGGTISVQHLSPEELLALSVQLLAKGRKDGAFPLLRHYCKMDRKQRLLNTWRVPSPRFELFFCFLFIVWEIVSMTNCLYHELQFDGIGFCCIPMSVPDILGLNNFEFASERSKNSWFEYNYVWCEN
ncbi:ALBINO3-like protein 2, chloroplastic isoform X2 [Diospyros lotus]|uniref:ALBINO3-like protein 2, chloroplastic isoform X2 n=1 Tax=Diospyros lotus TaxID=55363 RepID=UPI002257CCF9|nr:ALBINO3-like protein 2, chloroplastic isoform X2 [Diospyros lotus]